MEKSSRSSESQPRHFSDSRLKDCTVFFASSAAPSLIAFLPPGFIFLRCICMSSRAPLTLSNCSAHSFSHSSSPAPVASPAAFTSSPSSFSAITCASLSSKSLSAASSFFAEDSCPSIFSIVASKCLPFSAVDTNLSSSKSASRVSSASVFSQISAAPVALGMSIFSHSFLINLFPPAVQQEQVNKHSGNRNPDCNRCDYAESNCRGLLWGRRNCRSPAAFLLHGRLPCSRAVRKLLSLRGKLLRSEVIAPSIRSLCSGEAPGRPAYVLALLERRCKRCFRVRY